MPFTVSLRLSNDLLHSVFSYINDVMFHDWVFGLARFVCVDVLLAGSVVCVCVVGVTALTLCDFALWRLVLVLHDYSVASDGTTSFPYICVWI